MTSNELLKKYKEELIILEKSHEKVHNEGLHKLAFAREKQCDLVRRFIKDLEKLLEAQLKSHNTFNCNEQLAGNKKCDRQCARVDCYHLNK